MLAFQSAGVARSGSNGSNGSSGRSSPSVSSMQQQQQHPPRTASGNSLTLPQLAGGSAAPVVPPSGAFAAAQAAAAAGQVTNGASPPLFADAAGGPPPQLRLASKDMSHLLSGSPTSPGVGSGSKKPSRTHWLPDNLVSLCMDPSCGVPFSLFERKHHCRRCGGIFCAAHSNKRLNLNADAEFAADGTPSKVCTGCFHEHSVLQRGGHLNTEREGGDGKVRNKVDPQKLVQQSTLKGENSVAPALRAAQELLRKAQLESALERHIADRPSPRTLVENKILEDQVLDSSLIAAQETEIRQRLSSFGTTPRRRLSSTDWRWSTF